MASVNRVNFLSQSSIGFLCKPRNISLILSSIFSSIIFFPYVSLNEYLTPLFLQFPWILRGWDLSRHAGPLSSQAIAAVSGFLSRWYRDLWLSFEAFPRGLPTGLSHVPLWFELILGVKVEAVQGNQVPLEWTETFGGLLEWWHDPLSSSRHSCWERLLLRCDGNARNPFPTEQGILLP